MAKVRKLRTTKPVVETAEPVVEPEAAPVVTTTPAIIAKDVMNILEAVVIEPEPEIEPVVVVSTLEVVAPKVIRRPERKGPTARVLLRTGHSLNRRGNVYRQGQPFIISGENAIRTWEQDSAFVVERLP